MKNECPRCGSDRIIAGRYLDQIGGGGGSVFRPSGIKVMTLSGCDIRIRTGDKFTTCLDCGLLWSKLDEGKAEQVMKKHGNKKTKERLGLAD